MIGISYVLVWYKIGGIYWGEVVGIGKGVSVGVVDLFVVWGWVVVEGVGLVWDVRFEGCLEYVFE